MCCQGGIDTTMVGGGVYVKSLTDGGPADANGRINVGEGDV